MAEGKGKVAIVTGAGQGIGLGIAHALARKGVSLVISGRDGDKLKNAAAELAPHGVPVETIAVDVRQRQSAVDTVKLAIDRFGKLDILVNNAQQISIGTNLEDLDDEAIASTTESGLYGTLFHMQAAFPHMKAQGGGAIINLGSREGIFGGLGMGIYAATKEAIRGLSRVAAREWGKYQIRVNVICPAGYSPGVIKYFSENPGQEQYYLNQIPLGRLGDPIEDIGQVAVFLGLDESRFVTGQTINVDGGQMML